MQCSPHAGWAYVRGDRAECARLTHPGTAVLDVHPRHHPLPAQERTSPRSFPGAPDLTAARWQLAVVYLGVALAKTDEKGSSKAVEYTVIVISFAFSGLAAYYIYWYMNKSRLVVWRLHRYVSRQTWNGKNADTRAVPQGQPREKGRGAGPTPAGPDGIRRRRWQARLRQVRRRRCGCRAADDARSGRDGPHDVEFPTVSRGAFSPGCGEFGTDGRTLRPETLYVAGTYDYTPSHSTTQLALQPYTPHPQDNGDLGSLPLYPYTDAPPVSNAHLFPEPVPAHVMRTPSDASSMYHAISTPEPAASGRGGYLDPPSVAFPVPRPSGDERVHLVDPGYARV